MGVGSRGDCVETGFDALSGRGSGRGPELAPSLRPFGFIASTSSASAIRYGYRKIHAILRSEGTAIGRDQLRLIRKREDLQVAVKAVRDIGHALRP